MPYCNKILILIEANHPTQWLQEVNCLCLVESKSQSTLEITKFKTKILKLP